MMSTDELLDRYLRGECNAAEMTEIRRRLREDEAFGAAFVAHAVETTQLIETAGEIATAMPAPRKRRNGRLAVLALAATAVMAFAGWRLYAARESRSVARLVNEVAAVWADGKPVRPDGGVRASHRMRLEGGFAEFAFGEGARLIVEGPAELVLVDEGRARLLSGRAVARMTPGSDGFVLETPAGEVVDRGTEFGVVVDADATTQVHAFSGTVAAGERRLEDSAVVVLAEGAAVPDAFMRVLPPLEHPTPDYLHWSFDGIADGMVADTGTGILGARWNAQRRGALGSDGPEVVPGMIGDALYFDGRGAYLQSDFAGVGKGDSRTVAFWAKVPVDAQLDEAYAMLGWGSFKYLGATWQISWNCEPEDGPLGRLRAGVHGGQVIGSRDLRDGRWHHLAVVLFGGERPDVATHVMLYVDGELEATTRKAVRAVQTDLGSDAKAVAVGRNAGRDPKRQFFRGWIDDVIISNEPLSPAQIRRVMQEGGDALRANRS